MGKHENRIILFAVSVGLALVGSVCADDNVRAVQEKLREGGFYSGEIDGAYSSQLAAALTRYQVRKGLPVTGQLDVDTSNALDAKPAVTKNTAAPEQSSETWRQLRRREQQTTSTDRASEILAAHRSIGPRGRTGAKRPGCDFGDVGTCSAIRRFAIAVSACGHNANVGRDHGTGVSATGYSANLVRSCETGASAARYSANVGGRNGTGVSAAGYNFRR